MKTFTIALFMMIHCSEGFGQKGWQHVSSPDNNVIYNMKTCGEEFIYFYDYCAGGCIFPTPGSIFISQDAGKNWYVDSTYGKVGHNGNMSNGHILECLFFKNPNLGFLSGYDYENQYGVSAFDKTSSFIKHSSDQRHTWSDFSMPTETLITNIFFVSDKIGYAIGTLLFDYATGYNGSATINQTNDGGITWNILREWKGFQIIGDIIFADSITFLASFSNTDSLLLTLDGGNTWFLKNRPSPIFLAKAIYNFFYRNSTFYASCDTGYMKSIDWGDTWEFDPGPHIGRPYVRLSYVNDSTAYWASDSLIKTTNSGKSWFTQLLYPPEGLTCIATVSDSVAYAIGEIGLYKTIDGGGPPISSVGTTKTEGVKLMECFPNPANDKINFTFLPNISSSFLSLFDELGRELRKFIIAAGQNSVELETTSLPKGIYYIRYNTQNCKFVILK